ncbi:hypothetical protein, partial [Cereibacter sphaeroides]
SAGRYPHLPPPAAPCRRVIPLRPAEPGIAPPAFATRQTDMGASRDHADQHGFWRTVMSKKRATTAVITHKLYAQWPGQPETHIGFRAMTNIGSSIEILFEPLHLENASLRAESWRASPKAVPQ